MRMGPVTLNGSIVWYKNHLLVTASMIVTSFERD